jgi:hypothetical protein
MKVKLNLQLKDTQKIMNNIKTPLDILKMHRGINFTFERYLEDNRKIYELIKGHLPEIKNRSLQCIDYGCGFSGFTTFIHSHYKSFFNAKKDYYLVDFNEINITKNKPEGGYHTDGYTEKYCSFDFTQEFLTLDHKIPLSSIHFIDAEKDKEKKDKLLSDTEFDIAYSFLSAGFHYPLLNNFLPKLKINGILIVDVRHDTGQLEVLKSHYSNYYHRLRTITSKQKHDTLMLKRMG